MAKGDEMSELEQIKLLISKLGTGGYKDGSSVKKGYLYHKIPFEEFNDVPTHNRNIPKEYLVISEDIGINNLKGKRILEIGCANGHYTFNFCQHVKEIIAFEGDENVYAVNEAVRKYKNIENIKFVNSYFDENVLASIEGNFDIVIMTNVHMWIYKQLGSERTKNIMKELSKRTNVLYFQTVHSKSKGMFKVEEFNDINDIENYLHECGFNDTNHVYTARRNRRFMFKCRSHQ